MAFPEITDEQRAENLMRAQAARKERGDYKKALKAGKHTIEEALDAPIMQKCRVFDLLKSMPGVGKAVADAIMGEIGIDPKRRVKGLGAQQRKALIAKFV